MAEASKQQQDTNKSVTRPVAGPSPEADRALAGTRPAAAADEAQVKDHGTDHLEPEEVANGAAESLHGANAAEEQYVQPAANVLPGGSTLIAASTPEQAEAEGDKRETSDNA
jgi:hypothetical protein